MVAENVANHAWNFQTAQGTPAATSAYRAFLAGGSMVGAMGEDADFEETTSQQMIADRYAVERHAGGVPEFYAMPNSAASLLYAVLGNVVTTGASDPWTHTCTLALTRPWLTFWKSQGALIYEESSDCKVDQLVISGESGRPLRLAATISGLRPRHQTAEETAATIETTMRHVFYHGDGALMLEGAAVASIGSFQMTIIRNGELIGGDGLAPIDNTEGRATVQTAVTRLLQSASLRNRKWYGTASPANDAEVVDTILELGGDPSLDFKFTRQASPERSIRLQVKRVTVAPYEIPIGTGSSPVREAITLDALRPSSGDAITAIVKNSMSDLTP